MSVSARSISCGLVLAVITAVLVVTPGGPVPGVGSDRRAEAVVGGLSTLAGSGSAGQADGIGAAASFDSLVDLAGDSCDCILYALEQGKSGRPNQVRAIDTATGEVTTHYSGGLLGAAPTVPRNIKVDPSGDVWVSLTAGGSRSAGSIIRIDAEGTAQTMLTNLQGYPARMNGDFEFSADGSHIYYFGSQDGLHGGYPGQGFDRVAHLFRASTASLPMAGDDGELLGGTGHPGREQAVAMEWGPDGALYIIWHGSGEWYNYYPELYRYVWILYGFGHEYVAAG